MSAYDPKWTFKTDMIKLFLIAFLISISACSSTPKTTDISEVDDVRIGHVTGCSLSEYTPAAESKYILPYPVGKEYVIGQGNCGMLTHQPAATMKGGSYGDIQFAYDFSMPIGDEIVSVADGVVINIEELWADNTNDVTKQNFIAIEHDDGRVSAYVHLTSFGSFVEIGDNVKQGQVIGKSGQSGYALDPHLHFSIFEKDYKDCNIRAIAYRKNSILHGCKTIPVTFRNSEPLDTPPREGRTYIATEY
ncbi:MAG: M23 family metallopeptidase [Gammaproteobacteria bacterium]